MAKRRKPPTTQPPMPTWDSSVFDPFEPDKFKGKVEHRPVEWRIFATEAKAATFETRCRKNYCDDSFVIERQTQQESLSPKGWTDAAWEDEIRKHYES